MDREWGVKMTDGEVVYIYARDPQEAVRNAVSLGYRNIYGVISKPL